MLISFVLFYSMLEMIRFSSVIMIISDDSVDIKPISFHILSHLAFASSSQSEY